jgi:hypothetical protein
MKLAEEPGVPFAPGREQAIMRKLGLLIVLATGTLALAAPVFSQNKSQEGQGQAIVTVLAKQGGDLPARVSPKDLKLSVDGKQINVTKWTPLLGPDNHLELVVLIDGSARISLGTQMGDMAQFLESLPANTKAAIAYMQNGRAVFAGPLSTNHAQVVGELHLPGGAPGSNSSPYFCLSDLAQHWPSQDGAARREVVMITDGVDGYNPHFEFNDSYVEEAIDDAVRARLVVYAIAWSRQGFAGRSAYEANAGQSLLLEVAQATGGKSFWEGSGNPVAFQPFLEDLARRLKNQYELGFVARLEGKPEVESLELKSNAPATSIDAPREVLVGREDVTKN